MLPLIDCNAYFNALENKKIKTLKDALKHFNVRYSTFSTNFSKEGQLPGCTLAQNGFYYDDNTRSIRCIECDFSYNDLQNDSFFDILSTHVRFRASCEQARQSLRSAIETDEIRNPISEDYTVQHEKLNKKSPHKLFSNEEMRIKTFENIRLALDVKQLAQNGFYRVVRDCLKTVIKKSSTNSPNSSSNSGFSSEKLLDNEMSYIEAIASQVPALHHIKCAFCSYECLIFKNSVLNTLYKSPFEDHREKSANKCLIFSSQASKMEWSSSGSTDSVWSTMGFISNDIKLKLDWLQALFDFDSVSNDSSNFKKIQDILVNPALLNASNLDDLEIKRIPKVLDHLFFIVANSKVNKSNPGLVNSANAFLYVPGVSSGSSKTTSDFNQLQNVLIKSENVMSEKAYHPNYAQYQARLDTYKDWPATLSQQPVDLAKAGFYYFGIKDMVKCFFCNGGLKNWDHNDDPFQDHVRWFPKCQFIRQLMGHEYVEQIKDKFKNMESGFSNDANNSSSSNQSTSSSLISGLPINSTLVHQYQQNRSKRSVSPRTLNSRLDTFIVRKMLDNNIITKDSIKQSIEIKLSVQESGVNAAASRGTAGNPSVYGDDFKSPVDMALFSYDIDRAKKDKLELFNSISDFIICNLPQRIKPNNIKEFISIKYGLYPESVRIIREQGLAESRCFCLVTMKKNDKQHVDEIINDLEKNTHENLAKICPNAMIIKTNWIDIEEKVKPLIGKSIDVSASIEALQQQQQQQPELQSEPSLQSLNLTKTVEFPPEAMAASAPTKLLDIDLEEEKKPNKELVDEAAQKLIEENERLKNERLCVICLTKEKNVLFLPCAHLTACLDCSFSLTNCPMCRTVIQATVRTFN